MYKRQGYKYSHDFPQNFVQQEFLPEEISGTAFFQAGSSIKEQEIKSKTKERWGDKYDQ